MKLVIDKLGTFEIDGSFTCDSEQLQVSSIELFQFVDDLQAEAENNSASAVATPPPPPAPKVKVEVTYEMEPGCN